MPIAYYLVPYQPHPTRPRARVCAMDDHTPEIDAQGGAWSESEVLGNRAVVRVRASTTLLNQLALLYPRLSETEAAAALKLGRAKPRYDAATDRIVFAPIADQPAKPLAELVRQVPDVAPSRELTELLGLWMAVGFGEGWRLPWDVVLHQALSGLPPLWGAAFPTTSVLDNFNRADTGPPPSANWSQSWLGNGFKVVTNQAAPNVDGSNNGNFWNVSTFGPDSEVWWTVASIPSTSWFRYLELQLRLANPTSATAVDGYAYSIEPNGAGVPNQNRKWRIDNGAYTQLGATVTQQYGAGDKMGLEMIGSSLQMYRQPSGGSWAALGTASTDTAYSAAGYIGIASNSTVLRIDDFGGGTVVIAGGGAQTITATGIASGEAFGTARVNLQLRPTGIASAEAVGQALLRLTVAPTGIGSAESFGAARLVLQVLPSGISSAEAFGSSTINLQVRPSGIASGEAIGSHLVTTGGLVIQPTGIAGGEAFGTARLSLTISPSGISSAESFGSPTVGLSIRPTGIASSEAFGTARLGLTIAPTGIASGETVGAPVVLPGPVTIVVSGIASGESVGSPMVVLVESQTPRRVLSATGHVYLIDGQGRVYTINARARDYLFTGNA